VLETVVVSGVLIEHASVMPSVQYGANAALPWVAGADAVLLAGTALYCCGRAIKRGFSKIIPTKLVFDRSKKVLRVYGKR
jgi:hypothetical protein